MTSSGVATKALTLPRWLPIQSIDAGTRAFALVTHRGHA